MVNMVHERGYASVDETGIDSARVVFFHNDGLLIGVQVGPGYDPFGVNKPGWAWGGYVIWDGEKCFDMSKWMESFLSGEDIDIKEEPLCEFDQWDDKERVVALAARMVDEAF